MSLPTMNNVIDKLTEARNMCVSQRDHIRSSERIAEKREQEYEKALEKAREAERLKRDIEKLQRELQKRENVIERAAENERLKREIERLNSDIVYLHEQCRRWRGIAVARKAEITHRDNQH